MALDDSAKAKAEKAKLQAQLAEINSELEEKEYSHSIEQQKNSLQESLENYQKEQDEEIQKLKDSLEEKELLIYNSLESVKQNSYIVGEEIKNMAQQHGISISDAIITSWQNGENAIASYGATLSAGSSAFIGNIIGVENEVYALQNQANVTADSLAWMFATRADNLVGQLTNSYYSEANLNAMTNALRDSLVNTLERGYNVGSITSAFDSIASAANTAAAAVREYNKAMAGETGGGDGAKTTIRTDVDSKGNSKYSIVKVGSTTPIKTFDTYDEAYDAWKNNKYAKGVHNLDKDELAWTQEYGQEMILSPTRNAVLTPLKQGDTVLTKDQTDAIYEWSKLNPNTFVPNGMKSMLSNISKVQPVTNSNSPTLEFNGTLMHIDKVDSTNIKQMENIANKAVDRLVTQMSDGIRYRSM